MSPAGAADGWHAWRVPHAALRLADIIDDPACFGAGPGPSAAEVTLGRMVDCGPWADAERLWDRFLTGGTRAPGFRLVHRGATLARADCCRSTPIGHDQVADVVEPNRVLEHYAGGASVVLQGLQFSDRVFAELSTNLALELDLPVQVNAYLTPPAEQSLDVHFDFHDVVIAQLAGRKRWRVWTPLPRSERPVRRGPPVAQPTLDELGAPTLDKVVQPGDTLTVPRGFPHLAETVDEESVHLTIGLMALTWNRVVAAAADAAASGTALADRVPFGGLGGIDHAARPSADAAVGVLGELLHPEFVRRAIATEVWRRQPQTRLRARRPLTVGVHRPVAVTPGPLLWLDERSDGKHVLHLGDRQLRFPTECTTFVVALLSAGRPITPATVDAELDEASRRTVVDRLATEGVVSPCAAST